MAGCCLITGYHINPGVNRNAFIPTVSGNELEVVFVDNVACFIC